MILATLVVSWSALGSMTKSHDVASFVHTTLNERYGRTRRTADYAAHIEDLFEQLTKGGNASEIIPELQKNSKSMKEAADALQMARYPEEIGAVKAATKEYLDILDNKIIPALLQMRRSQALSFHTSAMIPLYIVIQNNVVKVNGYQIKAANESVATINDTSGIYTVAAITICVVILAIIIIFYMPKIIIRMKTGFAVITPRRTASVRRSAAAAKARMPADGRTTSFSCASAAHGMRLTARCCPTCR